MAGLRGLVRSIGRTARKGVKTASKAAGSVTRTIDRVPVVGRPLALVYGASVTAPLQLANDVARGARIDRAAMGHLKRELGRAKALAPYVQTVVSFVPGVGQGVGAAIGAGVALAEGRPLSAAVVEGIRGALPGGPAAQAAFELGRAAASGKPLDAAMLGQSALGALRLSPQQREVLARGLGAARDIAAGRPVDEALFQRAQALLPPEARNALGVGIAVAKGQALQGAVKQAVGPQTLAQLDRIGADITAKHGVLRAGSRVLPNAAQRSGFSIGAGLVAHRTHAIDRLAVRAKLAPQQRVGFDLAVASVRGLGDRRLPPPPAGMDASARLGYYAVAGLATLPQARRSAVARAVVRDPAASRGGTAAAVGVEPSVRALLVDDDAFDGLFLRANDWEHEQSRRFVDDLLAGSDTPAAM